MIPLTDAPAAFEQRYDSLLKHLKLKGMQPKTIDAYARAIRTMGKHFDWQIDALSAEQLTDYFHARIASHSWSAVKLDLYGYKFYVVHALRQPWTVAQADQAAQGQPLARHPEYRAGPGRAGRHPRPEFPGLLLRPV
jgi:hypothetical protein